MRAARASCAGLREAAAPTPSLSQLLRRFFGYYAAQTAGEHDRCFTVRGRGVPAPQGFYLSKAAAWPRAAAIDGALSGGRPSLSAKLSIEDPFETHDSGDPSRRHDLGATLSASGMARLRQEYERAARLLGAGDASWDEGSIPERSRAEASHEALFQLAKDTTL